MENEFEQKVADFWRDVQAECDPIQKELGGLTYYVFQTKYRFNPDLMIVGMNPGGGFTGEKF